VADGFGAIPAITAAEITDEIWLEVARSHADGAAMRLAMARAQVASSPVAIPAALPLVMPLPALLRLDGPAFIAAAYATVLARAPDETGAAWINAELARGRSKIEVLGQLQSSTEARERGTRIPGLGRRYLARRLYRVPLVGPVLRLSGAVLRVTRLSRLMAGRNDLGQALRSEMESRLATFEAAIERRRQATEERLAQQQTAVEMATRRLSALQAAQEELARKTRAAIAEQDRLLTELTQRNASLTRQIIAMEDSVMEPVRSFSKDLTDQSRRNTRLEQPPT
jgi:hypothetical protein